MKLGAAHPFVQSTKHSTYLMLQHCPFTHTGIYGMYHCHVSVNEADLVNIMIKCI